MFQSLEKSMFLSVKLFQRCVGCGVAIIADVIANNLRHDFPSAYKFLFTTTPNPYKCRSGIADKNSISVFNKF
jgi:hypothetical protein